jgi:Ca2+-binding RTX toxin-like protein
MALVDPSTGPRGRAPRRIPVALVAVAAACLVLALAASANANPATGSFSNSGTITIPAGAPTTTSGPSNPYPSTIDASRLYPNISSVTATFQSLTHTFPDDIDALLVGPHGQNVLLMSDTGGNLDVNNVNLTFDDAATSSLPDATQITSGTYRPTNIGAADTFTPPAPSGPFGSTLSVFNGISPNGTWRLFIFDDLAGDVGTLVGWSLNIRSNPNPGRCSNTFTLTDGNDQFTGGSGGDRILGRRGNDILRGVGGGDCLSGSLGGDRLSGGSGRDRITGNSGRDRISGGSGNDRISGGSSNDRSSGGSSNDRISGGSGRDRISGNSGRDRISGNSGNDTLSGGSGRDRVSGGSGKDKIRVKDGFRDRVNCGSGNDVVRADSLDNLVRCETVLH